MTIDGILAEVAGEIRAANAVAIIGAGASICAGYPLTRHLKPHLWKAIDADPLVLQTLAERLGRDCASAKILIGDDESALREAYKLVRASPFALTEFQKSFQALDKARTSGFSTTHDVLAELLHRRILETIISLNWDTMLEAAYQRRYGRILRPDGDWLHKPHGDASDPFTNWVLPNEPGAVPSSVSEQINAFAETRPRVLLIVGYSERDEDFVDRLILPLESHWRVVRIGPSVKGELAIPLPANKALSKLRSMLTDDSSEFPGWEYVSFQNQNNLGAALDGRGLGPSDVCACPCLPEVITTVEKLRVAHSAIIEGAPGCGKSMVAYHAAHRFCKENWEILRLVDTAEDPVALLGAIGSLPTKTLLLADDVQTLPLALTRGLVERARSNRLVLLITNERPADTHGVVHISGKSAVRALAAALRARREETLALVHAFDPRVGEGWMDVRLEDRLTAAEQAQYPWQFSFILTAGEKRARGHMITLQDDDRADLLLGTIAAHQLATRDLGVTQKELELFAVTMGKDPSWVKHSLKAAQKLRLVVWNGEYIKCPHQQYAKKVLKILFQTREEPSWTLLTSMIRRVVQEENPSLSGIAMLLRELWFTDALRLDRKNTVVDDKSFQRLMDRCLTATTPSERAGAGYLIEALDGYHPGREAWILEHASIIGRWLTEATAESSWGLSWLVNALNESSENSSAVFSHVNPFQIAASVNSAPLSQAYAWNNLLSRLALGGEEWRNYFRAALIAEPFLALARSATKMEVEYVCTLAAAFSRFDQELALDMVTCASTPIARYISEDFPRAYSKFDDTWNYVFNFVALVLGIRRLSKSQKKVMRTITKQIDPVMAAASIMQAPRRSLSNSARLLGYVREVDSRKAKQIVEHLDFEVLDQTTRGIWENPPHELLEFVRSLAYAFGNFEPVQSWIEHHEREIQNFPAHFAFIAPSVALRAHNAGKKIELGIASVLGWGLPACILQKIASLDQSAARVLALNHVEQMADNFRIPQSNQCEHLDLFVAVLQAIAPEVLTTAFDLMEPSVVRENWAERLRGSMAERRAAATLVQAAQSCSRLADIAAELRSRFPRASCNAHAPINKLDKDKL